MLELSLAHPLDVDVVGEAKGVEANVAGHGAIEVGRGGKEGHGLRLAGLARDDGLHLQACSRGDCVTLAPTLKHRTRAGPSTAGDHGRK